MGKAGRIRIFGRIFVRFSVFGGRGRIRSFSGLGYWGRRLVCGSIRFISRSFVWYCYSFVGFGLYNL